MVVTRQGLVSSLYVVKCHSALHFVAATNQSINQNEFLCTMTTIQVGKNEKEKLRYEFLCTTTRKAKASPDLQHTAAATGLSVYSTLNSAHTDHT